MLCHMWKNLFVYLCYLAGLCTCSAHATEQTQLIGKVGESVTFNASVLQKGYLFHDNLGTIAIVQKGSSDTEQMEQFKDRLQWDSQTGLFTITHLKTEDSGTYKVDSKDAQSKVTTFKLTVYNNVSMPNVTVAVLGRGNCSVLCSVENGREVTLSWRREGEILNHTSSPDLTTNLSLPLEMGEHNHTYYCEAKNPVSSRLLAVPGKCPDISHEGEEVKETTWKIIPIVAVCSLLGIIAVMGVLCLKRLHNREHEHILYVLKTVISPNQNLSGKRKVKDQQREEETNTCFKDQLFTTCVYESEEGDGERH